tara:strand:+ start:1310 stop:1546 length:237 start_codon:yes stop_codon:yes gene_type:complete
MSQWGILFVRIRSKQEKGLVNKNQVKGRMKQAKGKAKEVFGRVTGNKSLKFKGKMTKTAGKAQVQAGNLQKKYKEPSK